MKKKIALFAVSVLLSTLIFGCDKISSLSGSKKTTLKETSTQMSVPVRGPIVAKVNNIPISLEDLNQEIDAYNAMVPQDRPEAKISTREQKLDYLKNQKVRQVLLYQQAMDKGLDRQEEVLKALDKTKQDLLVMELLRQETAKIEASSKEIEDYYNTYKEQLKEPEERQIREIAVPTEQEAKDIMVQIMQGQDFATLAKEKSKAASAGSGGDISFIKRGVKPAIYDNAAFSDTLEVGKISNIFKSTDGYYTILKLDAQRGGKQKSLNDMWDDIKKGLIFLKQQQRIEELIGKLSREAKIEVYEGEVK